MATSGFDFTSDEIINIKCCVCTEENRTREAEKYCLECKDYFCSSCVRIHLKVPIMKGHNILDKRDFRSLGPDGSLPSFPTKRCSMHQAEVMNMYCESHDVVECPSCVALTHRSCRDIVSIPENIDKLYQRINLNAEKDKIAKTKKVMENIKITKEAKIQKLKEALDKEIKAVKKFKQDLQALLDKMETETIRELRQEFSRVEASLVADIKQAENVASSLHEAAAELKKSEGNKAREFVGVKTTLKLTVMAAEAEKTERMTTDETVYFTPDWTILTFLKQINALGKVSNKQSANLTCAPKDGLYEVKKEIKIFVSLKNDKKMCVITGSCLTQDGSLLLADNNNKKLKHLDIKTEKVKDSLSLPASPKAVCMISKLEAAVTLQNQSLQFVALGDKMTATRNLQMNHTCFGLACKDGKLFISDSQKTVYAYDINGLQQLKITKDGSGKEIFQSNHRLTVSDSGDRVFVADWNMGVIVLDTQGNYLYTLRDNNVLSCNAVCTDGRNVFVSGYTSNNIVQFGHNSKLLGEVRKVQKPHSLCFDHQRKRIIATVEDNGKITILELE